MVVHGLYWLAFNLAAPRPLLLVVDDGHWADEASLRWLAYLASRLEGLDVSLVVAMRPDHPARTRRLLLALRREAVAVVGPGLLSKGAVRSIVRANLGEVASDDLCEAIWAASGGNPLYATKWPGPSSGTGRRSLGAILLPCTRAVSNRLVGGSSSRWTDSIQAALRLAQALAVLGDGCELRDAAAIAEVETSVAARLAAGPGADRRAGRRRAARFVHPVVPRRSRGLAEPWGADDTPTVSRRTCCTAWGRRPASPPPTWLEWPPPDVWTLDRLRQAATAAAGAGAPHAAANLLSRALAEPPTISVEVLRQAARAEVSAGSRRAWATCRRRSG